MNERIKKTLHDNFNHVIVFFKWLVFSMVSGISIGLVGTFFYYCLKWVTDLRSIYPALIFALPLGGLLIVFFYRVLHNENDTGTNLVLSAIHSDENIPVRMAPLIFVSTLITHLCGGSAGREGAALQLGGSIGNALGKLFRFDEKDRHIMIMCGMSAAFSALFGTPMAAAIFSMEVVSVGIMYYAALVPCVISALVAHAIAGAFGIVPEFFIIKSLPAFTIKNAVLIAILAILCALVSILFCVMLHTSQKLYAKYLKNPYLRIFIGGILVILLTLLVGDQTYNGAGMNVIEHCMETATIAPEAFFLKILFTAVTLGAGYKGGQIVPYGFIDWSHRCSLRCDHACNRNDTV